MKMIWPELKDIPENGKGVGGQDSSDKVHVSEFPFCCCDKMLWPKQLMKKKSLFWFAIQEHSLWLLGVTAAGAEPAEDIASTIWSAALKLSGRILHRRNPVQVITAISYCQSNKEAERMSAVGRFFRLSRRYQTSSLNVPSCCVYGATWWRHMVSMKCF